MNTQNNTKKKNAGFSLVELIVVVLIMAVIAVVLAPQIMKWVENSRLSTDNQNLNQLVSNAQLALAKEAALKEVVASDGDKVITVDKNGNVTYSFIADANVSTSPFAKEFKDITGTFPKPTSSSVEKYIITVTVTDKKVKNVVGEAQDSSNAKVDLSNLD